MLECKKWKYLSIKTFVSPNIRYSKHSSIKIFVNITTLKILNRNQMNQTNTFTYLLVSPLILSKVPILMETPWYRFFECAYCVKSKQKRLLLERYANFFTSTLSKVHWLQLAWVSFCHFPACNYMFKVNKWNSRTRCEICSKLTIKTPEWHHWRRSGVFIVNFEHISHILLVFLLLTLSR